MSFARRGAKALGVSLLAAFGLMALAAGGAQGNWLVLHNGQTVQPDVTLGVSAHSEVNLLIPSKLLEIKCKTVASDAVNPLLLLAASTVAHGAIQATNCGVTQNHVAQPQCKPLEPIVIGGLGLLILSSGTNRILLEPSPGSGGVFTIKEYHGTCALPLENEVTGSIVLECGHLNGSGIFVTLNCANHQKTQLLRTVAPQPAGDGIFYGLNAATLDGIIAASISAPALYVGASWGGHI